MFRTAFTAWACAASLALVATPALSHVEYTDLGDPAASPGGVNGDLIFTNYGWFAGTRSVLGDSHELAGGGYFKFTLTEASLVTLTFEDAARSGFLNPAFTLYKGLFFEEAHDNTSVDPLNPRGSAPPFAKTASPVDNGSFTDAEGRVSPFRDTQNINYAGQFNALATWSMANAAGQFAVVEYVTHVAPLGPGNNAVSLVDFFLEAGDYTIAAAGGFDCTASTCVDPAVAPLNLSGIMRFQAVTAPVPEPAAVWTLASGLALVGVAVARRRRA